MLQLLSCCTKECSHWMRSGVQSPSWNKMAEKSPWPTKMADARRPPDSTVWRHAHDKRCPIQTENAPRCTSLNSNQMPWSLSISNTVAPTPEISTALSCSLWTLAIFFCTMQLNAPDALHSSTHAINTAAQMPEICTLQHLTPSRLSHFCFPLLQMHCNPAPMPSVDSTLWPYEISTPHFCCPMLQAQIHCNLLKALCGANALGFCTL